MELSQHDELKNVVDEYELPSMQHRALVYKHSISIDQRVPDETGHDVVEKTL